MNTSGTTTGITRNSSDSKETIMQLNQEVQRLKEELKQVKLDT